ncbi:unnamed protein product [Phaedon cochleariae]|uniref:Uncharacterized protein n=1 Tax=Phaedon cochleariae TaxID=80249 RepID=A0A9N9SE87_PHACE|nr:unnamed protein product [Phaedon cochleariae]
MHEKNGNQPAPQRQKTVAIVAPTRSNSLDYLNFEEKRRLIASSLSLSDFLSVGSADPKDLKDLRDGVATVIVAKKQNGTAFRTNSLGSGTRSPPAERKSKFSIGKLLRPWKWKRKRKSDKLEAVSRTLERKISVRANRDDLLAPIAANNASGNGGRHSPTPQLGGHQQQMQQMQQQQQMQPQQLQLQPQQLQLQPPPYPGTGSMPPPHLPPMSHALLQQQLLQNPHFAQANANNNNGSFNGLGKLLYSSGKAKKGHNRYFTTCLARKIVVFGRFLGLCFGQLLLGNLAIFAPFTLATLLPAASETVSHRSSLDSPLFSPVFCRLSSHKHTQTIHLSIYEQGLLCHRDDA